MAGDEDTVGQPQQPPSWLTPLARRLLIALAVVLLLAGLALVPVPLLSVAPGPAISLGERLRIGAAAGEPLQGDYLFLVVAVSEVSLVGAVVAWADPDVDVEPRGALIPDGVDVEDFIAESARVFEDATDLAIAIGLQEAGLDVDAGRLPEDVSLDGDGIGGPSAGLLTALAAYDLAAEEDLARGRLVTGTGKVLADGSVDRIGEVDDKVAAAVAAGAAVFLVPEPQLAEARAALPDDATMRLIGVASVGEAIAALRAP